MGIRDTWALTANGNRAKLVRYLGARNSQRVELVETNAKKQSLHKDDRPGRTFASHGSHRSGIELHTDPDRNSEVMFAEQLAALLNRNAAENRFGSLIITASPKTLGDLRSKLSTQLMKTVVAEEHKDYTNLPDADLVEKMQKIANENR